MPQRGVTLAEVEAAVQGLRAAARPVTARSVRHALGDRGSLTTLAVHLRAVRKQEAEQAADDESRPRLAIPDALAEGLVRGAERHWAELNDAAQAIVAQAQARAEERVAAASEAEHQAKAAEEGARAAQARTAATLTETERALETLRRDHAALVKQHRDLEATLGLAEERRRGAEALSAERKDAIEQRDALLARAQGELGEARSALERHRSEDAARKGALIERLAETEKARREAADATEQIGARLGDTESALERVNAERDEAIGRYEEFRNLLDVERRAHARTESEVAALGERCESLGRALDRSERQGQTIIAALERAEERAARAQAVLEACVEGAVRRESATPEPDDVD